MTSSTQDNTKLLQQVKSGFKFTIINWNKYQKQQCMRKTNVYIN